MTDNKQHREAVCSTKSSDAVSWYQLHADRSFQLIQATGLAPQATVIDVGGGASMLVDDLPVHAFDVWHDRAVFHFLTRAEDRQAYVARCSSLSAATAARLAARAFRLASTPRSQRPPPPGPWCRPTRTESPGFAYSRCRCGHVYRCYWGLRHRHNTGPFAPKRHAACCARQTPRQEPARQSQRN
jgi:hypothetical protein